MSALTPYINVYLQSIPCELSLFTCSRPMNLGLVSTTNTVNLIPSECAFMKSFSSTMFMPMTMMWSFFDFDSSLIPCRIISSCANTILSSMYLSIHLAIPLRKACKLMSRPESLEMIRYVSSNAFSTPACNCLLFFMKLTTLVHSSVISWKIVRSLDGSKSMKNCFTANRVPIVI